MCNEVFKVEYNSEHLSINLGKNKDPQYSLKSYTNRHLINDKNVAIKKVTSFYIFVTNDSHMIISLSIKKKKLALTVIKRHAPQER